ncbi:hypothetical protein [Alkalihalobacillus sp. TS-13]|uniref:hypothetical protein n=1 Tax=Alkalihalobacillus sp. TS-13 TaxID=2842455 RepID=UPI0021A9B1AE|nr:hypothetical protein [Alkalihalobacillus sp. TS-13]
MKRKTWSSVNHKPFIISLIFLVFIGTFTLTGNSLPVSGAADKSSEELRGNQKKSEWKKNKKKVHTAEVENQYKKIGYYAGWAAYSGFQVSDIDASKLTHINYAFCQYL